MDYNALYKFRFKDVNLESRKEVWKAISKYIFELSGKPNTVLDPACGLGEFIEAVPAAEKWALDIGIDSIDFSSGIRFQKKSFTDSDLPKRHSDLVFMSNVLEHLPSQFAVNEFLVHARELLSERGRLVILGPNFKYCYRDYFDCADHIVPLTHVSVTEHLVAAGYEIDCVYSRFLPYSFRSILPANRRLTELYLKTSPLWRVLGKQFLLIAHPAT